MVALSENAFSEPTVTRQRRLGGCVIALLAVVYVVARTPELLFEAPRLYAEEGQAYLAAASSMPWWKALLSPQQGYFSLPPNIATVLGFHLLSLENIPFLTTWVALILQLIPVFVILTSPLPALKPLPARAIAVGVVLAIAHEHVLWLTTIGSQFHLAIAAAIILCESAPSSPRPASGPLRKTVLLLAGLSGVLGVVAAPVWLWFASRDHAPETRRRAAIVTAAALVQFTAVLSSGDVGDTSPVSRLRDGSPGTVGAGAFTGLVAMPLLGTDRARAIADDLLSVPEGSFQIVGVLLGAVTLAMIMWLGRGSRFRGLASGLTLITFVTLISVPGKPWETVRLAAPRYLAVPIALLALLLLDRARRSWEDRRRIVGLFTTAALVATITQLTIVVLRPLPSIDDGNPAWRTEVAAWRKNNEHLPSLWPRGWSMMLGRRPDQRASVEVLGTATDASGRSIPFTLDISPPAIGRPAMIRLYGAPPGARGRIAISPHGLQAPAAVPAMEWCRSLIAGGPDAAPMQLPFVCDEQGRCFLQPPIPQTTALLETPLHVQARLTHPFEGASASARARFGL